MLKFITATALTVALTATSASGQDTRAEELVRAQAEKAGRLTPNVSTATEKTLAWLEGHFTDPSTVYLTFGGLYPSSGFAPGVAFRHAFGHARFTGGGAYSVRAYKTAYASLGFPELLNDTLDIQTHVKWSDATQVPFYGIGNETSRDGRVNYGLRVFAAWTNHVDTKAINSLDTLVKQDGRTSVRHHLIDFGSTMGSASIKPREYDQGHHYIYDPGQTLKGMVSLGLYVPSFHRVDYPGIRAVGHFSADRVEPVKWKPRVPNPAFIRVDRPHPSWTAPVKAYFARNGQGWKLVGFERLPDGAARNMGTR